MIHDLVSRFGKLWNAFRLHLVSDPHVASILQCPTSIAVHAQRRSCCAQEDVHCQRQL